MKILVINGPNMNLLGTREPEIYGSTTLEDVNNELIEFSKTIDGSIELSFFQSNHEGEIVDIASDLDIIDKSGAWYSYNGEKIGQGKENVKALLKNNKELKEELENKIREHYGFIETQEK